MLWNMIVVCLFSYGPAAPPGEAALWTVGHQLMSATLWVKLWLVGYLISWYTSLSSHSFYLDKYSVFLFPLRFTLFSKCSLRLGFFLMSFLFELMQMCAFMCLKGWSDSIGACHSNVSPTHLSAAVRTRKWHHSQRQTEQVNITFTCPAVFLLRYEYS